MGKQGKVNFICMPQWSISSKLVQYGDHTETISMKSNISAIIIKYEKKYSTATKGIVTWKSVF